ncbi:unnamed protein product, partial [Fusarium graminearum]
RNSRRELVPRVADDLPAASLPTPEDQPANVSHSGQPAIFATFSPSASTGPQSDLPELEALKNKVKLLEDQLSKSSAATFQPQIFWKLSTKIQTRPRILSNTTKSAKLLVNASRNYALPNGRHCLPHIWFLELFLTVLSSVILVQ